MLDIENAHERDQHIKFTELGHLYHIRGNSDGYISVTTLIKKCFKEFNSDKVISKIMRSPNFKEQSYGEYTKTQLLEMTVEKIVELFGTSDVEELLSRDNEMCSGSKYYHISRQEIKDMWNKNGSDASTAGTHMHENIENYLNKREHHNDTKEFMMFMNFMNDHPYLKIYRTEMLIFAEDVKICGSVDALFQDTRDGTFVIGDWKRSKKVKMENKWEKGIVVATKDLDACEYNQYSLQLNIYKFILENHYSINIKDIFLVILHPDQDNYIRIDGRNLQTNVQILFEERRKSLSKI